MSRPARLRRALAALVVPFALVGATLIAAPAAAVVDPADPGVTDPAGPATEATIVDMLHTSGLFGGTVASATATTPYPTRGLTDQRSVSTALIVLDDPAQPGPADLTTYCIDLDTETEIGVHYELGDWAEANVPNLPYVQWILNAYFPANPAVPAGTDAEKVRAVQGAIWYFTDQFVVNRFYPAERAAVAEIVAAAQAALSGGTPPAPPLPTLTVSPATAQVPDDPDVVVGPFAVAGTAASGVLSASGVRVFSDAAGTVEIPAGASVPTGTDIWLRSAGAATDPGFALTATQTVEAGNVFVYDGNNPGRTSAQKLVLAADAEIPIRAAVDVVPFGVGSFDVAVTITGAAAGAQSALALTATCTPATGAAIEREIAVPARMTGSAVVASIADVPVGAECSVVQTVDGADADAELVASTVTPAVATIADGATSTIAVTNEYATPVAPTGDLAVELVIAGTAAGSQSEIALTASCTGSGAAISEAIAVPAGLAAGSYEAALLTGLAAGAECTVTQTADGSNAAVVLESSTIVPASVTIASGTVSSIVVTDAYAARVTPTPTPTPTPAPTPAPAPGPSPSGGGDALASTGADVLVPAAGGLLLLLAGAVALVVGLRRRSA